MISMVDQLETVIRGKRQVLELFVACAASGGHVLLDDLPGTGKTTLAKAFAALVEAGGGTRRTKSSTGFAPFKRIQFTPDLLPYDISGVDIFDPERKAFSFQPGPIFAHVVLADEINRTTPKVQSALLEAMAERQVTVGVKTYPLSPFFFVVATQNPIESEGTYPLPAAQLDRFMMRLSLGYPDRDHEMGILRDRPGESALLGLKPLFAVDKMIAISQAIDNVTANDRLLSAITGLCASSRENPALLAALSTRAALMLLKAARAKALMSGRDYAQGQDLLDVCAPVLAHRIRPRELRFNTEAYLREACLAAVDKAEKS